MFNFIKKTLQKIYLTVTSQLGALFGRETIDESTLKELEILLLAADTGVKTTRSIIDQLKNQFKSGTLKDGHHLKESLGTILRQILNNVNIDNSQARVHVLVGINGSGKTTFAGKLAHHYTQQGKKVLLVAADTFRAAAQEQLNAWAQKSNTAIVLGKPNQDPASVVFTGCEQFINQHYDILIIDTAGRLHTKVNLMNELTKIKRIINKNLPGETIHTLLTIDSMLGQNSFEQAKLFKESTDVNSIVLTKMDGTGKGGIVFAIVQELGIPIKYFTFGEKPDQFALFDPNTYVEQLLNQ
ncbi:MAG: signal recognition particle-docking protein FtsY [bacterium]|nr:signal recognition particle-docking protein FtsY [bacterium]